MACDPTTLIADGVCFDCLSDGEKLTIELALLAQIAGVSDPTTLIADGVCFDCLSAGEKSTIETQLLCEWASGG